MNISWLVVVLIFLTTIDASLFAKDVTAAYCLLWLLEALCNDATPTILVSSMCDVAPELWQVDKQMVEELRTTVDNIEAFQTSIKASSTHKRCISVMLRNIEICSRGKSMNNLLMLYYFMFISR